MLKFFSNDEALKTEMDKKFGGLGVPQMNVASDLSSAALRRETTDLDSCGSGWPTRTLESDITNLKMLLDERLFDSRVNVALNFSGQSCWLFMATPRISKTEINTAFGVPDSAQLLKNGIEVLTYGAFKIALDREGKAGTVMFAGTRK